MVAYVVGNWVLPLGGTVIVWVFAFSLMKRDVPAHDRVINRVTNVFLGAVASVASIAFWMTWAWVR
jgi:hypothetical protein